MKKLDKPFKNKALQTDGSNRPAMVQFTTKHI